ncbi:MAG TPA: Mur ligase family protein, partial [Clostridia bacterium]|nr:Mur ligase family protein [Clostridia bacterium]
GNYIGGDEPCVVEACEYKASFLTLRPTIGVILNVETDHLDYYKDLLGVERAFSKFASKVQGDGFLVYNGDQVPEHILKNVKAKRVSYGFEKNNNYQAVNLKHKKGVYAFDVIRNGIYFYSVELRIRGRHNIYNALATVVVCDLLNLDAAKSAEGINLFEGVERRWTAVDNDFTNVVLDYAHHPNEIRALIETARQQGYEKIIMAFQPHTYSRTQTLFRDFVTCFKGVDELILLPIYAAREMSITGITSERLARVINEVGITEAITAKDFLDCAKIIKEHSGKDDLTLVVGAGDINKLTKFLV